MQERRNTTANALELGLFALIHRYIHHYPLESYKRIPQGLSKKSNIGRLHWFYGHLITVDKPLFTMFLK